MGLYKFFAATFLIAVLSVPMFANSAVLTLSTNEFLNIEFSMLPNTLGEYYAGYDTLVLGSIAGSIISPGQESKASLFNGADLLGTDYGPFNRHQAGSIRFGWVSPTSLYTVNDPAIIDITSISNRTIDGLISVSITSGSVNVDTDLLYLKYGLSTGWGGYRTGIEETPIIENISIDPVPIPAAVWLFGSGLIGLIGIAKRKKT